jgi:hypothetical protein
MKVSYFETGRYVPPPGLPPQWPVPAGAYDPRTGEKAFGGMVERVRFVEELVSTGSASPSTITRRAS